MNVPRHKKIVPEIEGFEIPSWAGKPSSGLHLDVLKDKDGEVKMIQKMMVDEKKAYFFGRNPLYCDFTIDHASCSRVHAVLLFHKNLNKSFLVDLNSAHGTFIGKVRLEALKPTQIHLDSTISFGASTRQYIIRERPQAMPAEDHRPEDVANLTGLARFGLPQDESALDNLTEYNTAHNKRVTILSGVDENSSSEGPAAKKARFIGVRFREEEDVINPEDIDPTVGKFRNLIQTAIIPKTSSKAPQSALSPTALEPSSQNNHNTQHHILRPIKDDSFNLYAGLLDNPISSIRINSAPDVDLSVKPDADDQTSNVAGVGLNQESLNELAGNELMPKKKYFPKEAWPGRKPTGGMAI